MQLLVLMPILYNQLGRSVWVGDVGWSGCSSKKQAVYDAVVYFENEEEPQQIFDMM